MLNILSISNSFGVDATTYLHQIAKANNKDVYVEVLFVGGCSLERHAHNLKNNIKEYQLYTNGVWGGKNVGISDTLLKRKWDYIVLQQASYLSGIESSFYPFIDELILYIKSVLPKTKICFHKTWSYAPYFKDKSFENYNYSTSLMSQKIESTFKSVASKMLIESVIDSCAIIDTLRGHFDDLNRDGFHLNELGRYAAGLAWYSFFFHDYPSVIFVPTYTTYEESKCPLSPSDCEKVIKILFNK